MPAKQDSNSLSSHIEAFVHALKLDESYFDHQGDAASPQIPGTPVSGHTRIRKVSALSDFAPVNLKVKRFAKALCYLHIFLTHRLFQTFAQEEKRKAE